MKIKVSKKTVVKALLEEPLKAGLFISYNFSEAERLKKNVNCPVCAVGAIMSRALPNKLVRDVNSLASNLTTDSTYSSDFDGYENATEKVAAHLENGEYLSALSTLFEDGMTYEYNKEGESPTQDFRNDLVQFVTEEFPSTLILDTERSY